jgi:hypothetical protein
MMPENAEHFYILLPTFPWAATLWRQNLISYGFLVICQGVIALRPEFGVRAEGMDTLCAAKEGSEQC